MDNSWREKMAASAEYAIERIKKMQDYARTLDEEKYCVYCGKLKEEGQELITTKAHIIDGKKGGWRDYTIHKECHEKDRKYADRMSKEADKLTMEYLDAAYKGLWKDLFL